MNDKNIFGTRVSELLKMYGKTQCELAKQVGVTEVSISRYINGERTPHLDIALKIAINLNTTVEYLMGIEMEIKNADFGYHYAQNIIDTYYDDWTREQKRNIIMKLFDLN